jgi:hypothetical protein
VGDKRVENWSRTVVWRLERELTAGRDSAVVVAVVEDGKVEEFLPFLGLLRCRQHQKGLGPFLLSY